jgi:hypothetical protein
MSSISANRADLTCPNRRRKLHVGHFLRCPHCHRWHPVIRWHTSGTDYTLKMLYFRHNGQMFYAGQEGLESRHNTQRNDEVAAPASSWGDSEI